MDEEAPCSPRRIAKEQGSGLPSGKASLSLAKKPAEPPQSVLSSSLRGAGATQRATGARLSVTSGAALSGCGRPPRACAVRSRRLPRRRLGLGLCALGECAPLGFPRAREAFVHCFESLW
ncbi:uncharacterized protein LOC103788406 [Callithrix jacchus]